MAPYKTLLDSYVLQYKQMEPFEGLPGDIRLQLERLSLALGTNHTLLNPLTEQLQESVRLQEKTNKKQRFHTTGGFMLGVAGLLFGIFTSLFPLSTIFKVPHPYSQTEASQPNQSQENSSFITQPPNSTQ